LTPPLSNFPIAYEPFLPDDSIAKITMPNHFAGSEAAFAETIKNLHCGGLKIVGQNVFH
jgi:hypothetical protein